MNTPVNFELAKLLKEKGFEENCNHYYDEALFEGTNKYWEGIFPKYSVFKRNGFHKNSNSDSNELWFNCSAPTIAEVVMWLYENRGIWVAVYENETGWNYNINSIGATGKLLMSTGLFKSPTEAYEAALLYTLQNLIK